MEPRIFPYLEVQKKTKTVKEDLLRYGGKQVKCHGAEE